MKTYIFKFGKDFNSRGGALTLEPQEVGSSSTTGVFSKTHPDGWTIKGEVHEDYYYWVNKFEATHPKFGKVWGNFEEKVYATKKSGFKDFISKHPPQIGLTRILIYLTTRK